MDALTLIQVNKKFGTTPVLKNIDLSIESGSLVSILGTSGSGKTTLLRLISGIESLDSGVILKGGSDITKLEPSLRHIGMVFQDALLFPHLSVLENVAFGQRMRGISKKIRYESAMHHLDRVKMTDFAKRMPHQLSGGQKQRVSIARTLATDPDILLLDEPFSSLDPHLRHDMCELLKDIQNIDHQTIVLVTHDREEAMGISNKIAILSDHQILDYDDPRILYERPRHDKTAHYLGAINILGSSQNGKLKMIRPEHLKMDFYHLGGEEKIIGNIISHIYTGSTNHYTIRSEEMLYYVTELNHRSFDHHDRVTLSYADHHVIEVDPYDTN